MKFPGEAAERVARALLESGPSTAADLAEALGMTPAGVRRHLTALMDDGLVAAHDRVPYGPTPKRGRGRPSSVYALTAAGRAACDRNDDALAVEVLRFLQREYGPDAVAAFARQRARELAGSVVAPGDAASPTDVAVALTSAGYAAEVQPLGAVALQLCQHHCPVVDAAREFPVLCDAETEVLGEVMGRHVTRLATLAHGDEVCTAVIPNAEPTTTRGRVSA